jgi:hypothetical protein
MPKLKKNIRIMKTVNLFVTLSLLFCAIIQSKGQQEMQSCDQWRGDVKMLTDKGGSALLKAKPLVMDFDSFLETKAPILLDKSNVKDKTQPRLPSEKEVFEITAYITTITFTENENDFEMYLKSPDSDATMLAILPNPNCPTLDKFPAQRAQFRQTWDKLTEIMDEISQDSRPLKVKITGVRFWNIPNGDRGTSPSGVEIHPVLNVTVIPD